MNKHIEKARTWLSRPEAEIGTGGRCEIAGLVEDELWSDRPDKDRANHGSLMVKPADVLSLFERYDSDPDTSIARLDDLSMELFEEPTTWRLSQVVAMALALDEECGGR